MRTIGHRWPTDRPNGDYPVRCDICGVPWLRSQMTRDAAGHFRCPNDRDGRDAVTLSRLNAARRPAHRPAVRDGGQAGFTMQGQDYDGITAEEYAESLL